MPTLTPDQRATLKAFILASPTLGPLATSFDYGAVADGLNALVSPAFVVWRSRILKHDVTDKVSPTGTSFVWGGATGGYIARNQGERDCWRELWNSSLSVDPSLPNVRAAFDDIFSGSGAGAQNNKAHIAAHSKRSATLGEKVFAQGTGTDASPATLVVEGTYRAQDIGAILAA